MPSIQYDILSSAVTGSAIWMYTDGNGFPSFTPTLPKPCKWSMYGEECGVYLKDLDSDDLSNYLKLIDEYINSNFTNSKDQHKVYLLLTDVWGFIRGGWDKEIGHVRTDGLRHNIMSRLLHSEILIGNSLVDDAISTGYGFSDEDTYPDSMDFYTQKSDGWSNLWNGKCYGLVYLGCYNEETTKTNESKTLKIFRDVSYTRLPPDINTKLSTTGTGIREGLDHPYSHWEDDDYEEPQALASARVGPVGKGHIHENASAVRKDKRTGRLYVKRDYCYKTGDEYTMRDIFRTKFYNILYLNCQTFCKAFMSILRCSKHFTPVMETEEGGKNNIKLDIPQKISPTLMSAATSIEASVAKIWKQTNEGCTVTPSPESASCTIVPADDDEEEKVKTTCKLVPLDLYEKVAALAAELRSLKPSQLRRRAAEMGVNDERVDEAMDCDDARGALVALLLETAVASPSTLDLYEKVQESINRPEEEEERLDKCVVQAGSGSCEYVSHPTTCTLTKAVPATTVAGVGWRPSVEGSCAVVSGHGECEYNAGDYPYYYLNEHPGMSRYHAKTATTRYPVFTRQTPQDKIIEGGHKKKSKSRGRKKRIMRTKRKMKKRTRAKR